MYPQLIPGQRIPCPMPYGRGTHVLLLDHEQGELFCHCIHLKHQSRKTDKVLVSQGRLLTKSEADNLYVIWRDEIFAQAENYGN